MQDIYRRGLEGKNLNLIVTDGCEGLAAAVRNYGYVFPLTRRSAPPSPRGRGWTASQQHLAAAIQSVYPHLLHQRCWVHKMRNILEKVRKRDYEAVKSDAQAIYRAENRKEAQAAFRVFQAHWKDCYPARVKRLEQDLPERLSFFDFPRRLWRSLRTTNVIERCFVEVRRRTRPMVCFVNVQSVDRIISTIYNRFNEDWRNRILHAFTQAA